MTKAITSVWTGKRYRGPEPHDVSTSPGGESILPGFAFNGRIIPTAKNYMGVDVGLPSELEDFEVWDGYWNPGFTGNVMESYTNVANPHESSEVGTYYSRGFYQRDFVRQVVGVDYEERHFGREGLAKRRNMYLMSENELIGDCSTTNSGHAKDRSSILYAPTAANGTAGLPALITASTTGGTTDTTSLAAITLGANNTIRTLITTILTPFITAKIPVTKHRLAAFVPSPLYAALGILKADSGLPESEMDVFQRAFKGGVWPTDAFHYTINGSAPTATDNDIVVIDMDLVNITMMNMGIKELKPKTLEITTSEMYYEEIMELFTAISFIPVYSSGWKKAVFLGTAATTAAV